VAQNPEQQHIISSPWLLDAPSAPLPTNAALHFTMAQGNIVANFMITIRYRNSRVAAHSFRLERLLLAR